MKNLLKNIGPGTLIAAAFIGPGTVTVCTLAGVSYGFTLLWAVVLSIVATIVLQEMAARLGLVSGKGLAATVKNEIATPTLKIFAIILILSAILIGNAAYEAGNISGGVLGLQTIFGNAAFNLGAFQLQVLPLLIGAIAFVLLYIGNYKIIERFLVALVILMSISFLVAAVITNPDWLSVLKGIFVPTTPNESIFTIIALVGTTVVPYNLFLHASLVQEKWQGASQLSAARNDLYVSIILGGLVSMAIIICAGAVGQQNIANAADLAKGLEPLYGSISKYVLSIGLFAAGITSAITAPLAAAYVVNDFFGKGKNLKSFLFRATWMCVLFVGVLFSSIGFSSIQIIQFAQIANGLLLPIIAAFLIWAVNRKSVLENHTNNSLQNILGLLILVVALVLGARSLWKVFGL